jgi:uncharacterized protein YndB with AHSA1/START domain
MNDHTLTLTRHINTGPATAWRCWTDPELLATRFASDSVKVATFEVDPTSSGLFNVIMQMPGHDPTVAPAGCVLVHTKTRVWSEPQPLA